jgi:cyclophilin family peptidyl-prolyl cis-trans isomerase
MIMDNEVIYVDDDNIDGPWDGSIDHPFQYIQDALDVSNSGSMISVRNGVYYEHITIIHSVKLIGESIESTIIDGKNNGGVIEIQNGSDIFIQNFSIQNGSDETDSRFFGISVKSTEFLVVTNTRIMNNDDGIVIGEHSKNCMILSSCIMNNDVGVDICTSSSNLIYANTISSNNVNVIAYQSMDNLITNNNIVDGGKNAQFYDSHDQFNKNYWGRSCVIYPIVGKMKIEALGIMIPWIKFDVQPLQILDAFERNPLVVMKTSKGAMIIEIYQTKMPVTVNNFIRLSEIDFFSGLVFHRVVDDFVIQGGGYDVNGTNKVSPFGPIVLEINPEVNHVDGAISMARTSDPNSATSQFFICDGPQSRLDGNYSAFGTVIVGIDVLRAIASVETKTKHGFMKDWPVDEILIDKVEIRYT